MGRLRAGVTAGATATVGTNGTTAGGDSLWAQAKAGNTPAGWALRWFLIAVLFLFLFGFVSVRGR